MIAAFFCGLFLGMAIMSGEAWIYGFAAAEGALMCVSIGIGLARALE